MKEMKQKDQKMGFPKEFSIYIPLFSENEQEILKNETKAFHTKDSLIKVRDYLVDFVPEQTDPSDFLLFAFGKILFSVGDFETLESLANQYESKSFELWRARMLLRKSENEEALRIGSKHRENMENHQIFRLHATRTLAEGYFNLGNYEQSQNLVEQLLAEPMSFPAMPPEEKPVVNDILLDGHRDGIVLSRYEVETVKLENKINLALHMAKELEERNHIGVFYHLMGLVQRDAGKTDEAINYSKIALEIFQETGNKRMYSMTKGNLGKHYISIGQLDVAELLLNEAIDELQTLEENRNIAFCILFLGDIKIARGKYDDAILNYKEALRIIEKLNLKESYQYCVLAELYLQVNRINDMNVIMKYLDEDVRTNPLPVIEAYLIFLQGLIHKKNLNYGESVKSLEKALNLSDNIGRGELSAKIIMNLALVNLNKYDANKDEEQLTVALSNFDQVIPFFTENKLTKELSAFLLLQGKIFAIFKDYSQSYNYLQEAKDLAVGKKNKVIHKFIEQKISQINLHMREGKEIEWIKEPFSKDIAILEEMGLKYIYQSHQEVPSAPLALLVLHKSGIPLRSFIIRKRAVRDQLLFGGFIIAIKDMLSELFSEQKSHMMAISYGNYKILIEADPNGVSSVLVSIRDSFVLRRKIRQLTMTLSKIEFPSQFVGELDKEVQDKIDEEVQKLFGHSLTISDDLCVDS